MTDYITADPHFDRQGNNVVGRPFKDKIEMCNTILEEYNSRINKHDRLIIVGDFSFSEPAYWRQKLRCKNCILILGNHDNISKSRFAFGDKNIRQQFETKLKGHPIFYSHYPTLYWPKSHYGSFHGYGHVHDMRTDTILSIFPNIRSHDVSVDSAKRILGKWTCYSDVELYDILINRTGHDPVEFYKALRGEYNK